eukprot:gene3207-5523_t
MEENNINKELINLIAKLTNRVRTLETQVTHLTKTIVDNNLMVGQQNDDSSVVEPDSAISNDSCLNALQSLQQKIQKPDLRGATVILDDDYSPILQETSEFLQDAQENDVIFVDDEELTENSEELRLDDEYSIPLKIYEKLMTHQPAGIKFLWKHITNDQGCILADFMGLGKSIQTVTVLMYKKKFPNDNILIMSPLNVLKHWEKEFNKVMNWTNEKNRIKIYDISTFKTSNTRLEALQEWKKESGVLLCTYEFFRNCRFDQSFYELLFKPGPSLVILDEGHRIKHYEAQISKSISEIATLKRIILTGYPFQNNLIEYYTMINFVQPDYLGDLGTFKKLFEKPIANGHAFQAPENVKQTAKRRIWILRDRVTPFILRRDSSILKQIVPQKHEIVIQVQITKFQKLLYECLVESIKESDDFTVKNVLWMYNCVTLICNHPQIFIKYATFYIDKFNKSDGQNEVTDTEDTVIQKPIIEVIEKLIKTVIVGDDNVATIENSSKLTLAVFIIFQSKRKNEKIVLFSKSIATLNFIESIITNHNSDRKASEKIKFMRFDGSTSSEKREQLIDKFNDKNSGNSYNLFLISTRAGGEGINLHSANRVILLDVNWNPSHDNEAFCRYVVDDQTTSLSINEINEKHLFTIPENPDNDLDNFLEYTKDDITNLIIDKFSIIVTNVETQDQLLGEEIIEELSPEEQKLAYGEEQFDVVYSRKNRSNDKSKSEKLTDEIIEKERDQLQKKIESSENTLKRKIETEEILFDDVSSEDEEESTLLHPIKKQKVEDDRILIERLKELKSKSPSTKSPKPSIFQKLESNHSSPKSASSSGSEHKLFEKEKSKPNILRNKSTQTAEFRKLIREQINNFKLSCDNYFSNQSHNKNFEK